MISGGRQDGLTYCQLRRLKIVCDKHNTSVLDDNNIIQGLLAWDNTDENNLNYHGRDHRSYINFRFNGDPL